MGDYEQSPAFKQMPLDLWDHNAYAACATVQDIIFNNVIFFTDDPWIIKDRKHSGMIGNCDAFI